MTSSSDPIIPEPVSGFDSRDCINLVVDLQGDQTVRPLEGALLQWALAERARLAKWQTPPAPPAEPGKQEAS